ncbi:hypothetical protein [Streptomyces globosus]|uniref:hypothetical protein n=1 Tax=Streptomyces globosus TaxID=68209 RepID=UPI0013B37F50|nr:hypothetical protein [Streptomyces globosus]
MITQAASFISPCSSCGHEVTGWNVQLVRDGNLFWETEKECDICGLVVHDGDPGPAPDRIRNSLLLQHGTARLRLAEPSKPSAKILKVLRGALGLSLTQAKESSTKIAAGEFEGTFIEARFLMGRFHKEGIEVLIEGAPPVQ